MCVTVCLCACVFLFSFGLPLHDFVDVYSMPFFLSSPPRVKTKWQQITLNNEKQQLGIVCHRWLILFCVFDSYNQRRFVCVLNRLRKQLQLPFSIFSSSMLISSQIEQILITVAQWFKSTWMKGGTWGLGPQIWNMNMIGKIWNANFCCCCWYITSYKYIFQYQNQ